MMVRQNSTALPAAGAALPSVKARPPAATAPPRIVERPGVFYYLTLVYLFLFCSRLQELVPQVRVSAFLLIVLLAAMGLSMRAGAILRMPSGKLLIAFILWIAFCVPFSVWMGGSAGIFRGSVQSFLTVALMAAFIRTVRQAAGAMYVVGVAMAFAALLSFVAGSEQGGRLILGEGTLGDPNYYCFYLLAGLPFLWLATNIEKGIKKVAAAVLVLPVLAVIAKTGSRMGLLALFAGLLFLVLVLPLKQKIYLALAAILMVTVAAAVLPDTLKNRFTTLFRADERGSEAQNAAESSDARKELFLRSLEMTVKHPVLGLGPGMFTVGEAEEAKKEGRKGMWYVTHNTYTQLSSEVGVPGAMIFIAILFCSYRGLSPIRRADPDPRIRKAALFTQTSLVILSVAACFLSLGYGGIPFILIGLSSTFQLAVADGRKRPAMAVHAAGHRPVTRYRNSDSVTHPVSP